MVKLILSIFVISTLLSQTVSAKVLVIEESRRVEISGQIRNLTKQSQQLLKLGNKSKAPISVIIDSTGGEVFSGVEFIQAIDRVRSKGIKVRCVVTGKAMSMATHILAACSTRYALPTSLIMWHPMGIRVMMAKLTKTNTGTLNKQLRLLSDYLDLRLRKALQISEKKYREYEEGEYIVFGHDLDSTIAPKFLKLIDDVRNK